MGEHASRIRNLRALLPHAAAYAASGGSLIVSSAAQLLTFAILALQRYGFRPLEAVITAFVGVIGLCYLIETILGRPDFGAAAAENVLVRRDRRRPAGPLDPDHLGAVIGKHHRREGRGREARQFDDPDPIEHRHARIGNG